MSFETETINFVQMIRLTSDTISGSDVSGIRAYLEGALSQGARTFALVLDGPKKSTFLACGLLVICEDLIRRSSGRISLVVKPGGRDEGLRDLGGSLNIPVYNDETLCTQGTAETGPPPFSLAKP